MNKLSPAAAALLVLAIAAGCSSNTPELETETSSAQDLYLRSQEMIHQKSYDKAAEHFLQIEQVYPHSALAMKAQLMAGYAYYESKKYDEAIDTFKTFIQFHPGDKRVPYALYMIAMSDYEQIPTVERSQDVTEKSRLSFLELLERFPQTPYGKDAKLRLSFIKDHLAGKEMEIGRYYLSTKSYHAAINRFNRVVKTYESSSHTPEALHRLVEAYLGLGIQDQARMTASVLGHSYPNSSWYQESYDLIKTYLS